MARMVTMVVVVVVAMIVPTVVAATMVWLRLLLITRDIPVPNTVC